MSSCFLCTSWLNLASSYFPSSLLGLPFYSLTLAKLVDRPLDMSEGSLEESSRGACWLSASLADILEKAACCFCTAVAMALERKPCRVLFELDWVFRWGLLINYNRAVGRKKAVPLDDYNYCFPNTEWIKYPKTTNSKFSTPLQIPQLFCKTLARRRLRYSWSSSEYRQLHLLRLWRLRILWCKFLYLRGKKYGILDKIMGST